MQVRKAQTKKKIHIEFTPKQYGELCSVADHYGTTVSAALRKAVEVLLLLIRYKNSGCTILIKAPNEIDKELIF